MSLLWADDFSTYGVGGQAYMLDGLYAELGTGAAGTATITDDPDVNAPASSVAFRTVVDSANADGYSGAAFFRKVYPAAKTTIGGSRRLYMPSLPNTTRAAVIYLCDAANAVNVSLAVTTTGAIAAYRGDVGTTGTLLGTSTVALTAAAWHHVEFKVLASQTVGTIDVYVNGASVLALTGLDTVSGSNVEFSQVSTGAYDDTTSGTGNFTCYWKDQVDWDTAGTVNNDVMGTCYVGRFTVNSDASFNWTASTGATGYNLIDETGPSDADYISADATPPAASTFGLENLPAEVTSVRGIVLLGRMKKSDGGDCNVQMSLVDAGTPTNGADRAITTAYTYWKDILETNTGTGVAFTPTEFNSATFKINRTL